MNGSYSLFDYGVMVGGHQRRRAEAFTQALRRLVTNNSVVLDLGSGVGYFAIIAARLGAAHVYGIETNPAVRLAERLARDNGLADRVTFYHGDSTQIDLPRRADIILGDLGGALPVAGPNLSVFIDARDRHLAPGGVLLPRGIRLWGAVISKASRHALMTDPWDQAPFDLDFSRARAEALNAPGKIQLKAEDILSDEGCWMELDYAAIENPHAEGRLSLHLQRGGAAHGIALWLEYEVDDGIHLSSAPAEEPLPIYGQWFLPWPRALQMETGQQVEVAIRARRRKHTPQYIWNWITRVASPRGEIIAKFEQASLPIDMR